jgi:hypothetical protein
MKLCAANVGCAAIAAVVVFVASNLRATDPKELVENSISPNGHYALAVLPLDKERLKRDEAGRMKDESLFLVDGPTNRKLLEVSEDFRRSSSGPYPRYEAAWSADDSHVAAVATFRRNSEIVAYEKQGEAWKRIELPRLDPFDYARLKTSAKSEASGQSEITKVEWKGNTSLAVSATAYLKTPRVAEMQISYSYLHTNDKWELTVESSEVETE